jgi:hypothetical protein
VSRTLAGDGWPHTSAPFRCLDLDVVVHTSDPAFATAVDIAFAACAPGTGDDAVHYSMDFDPSREHFVLECDREPVTSTEWACVALDYLVWDINRRVVDVSNRQLLVHAAAAARDGVAVIVPAVSGGGKSTLVAALVAAGFEYLSDEIVAIERDGASINGYHKAIALKEGSWPLVDAGAPTPPIAPFMAMTRYVTPAMLGSTVAEHASRPGLVVIPDRDAMPGPPIAMHRAEALTVLAEQSFNFEEFGPTRLAVLADVVRQSRCYRVPTANLAAAVDAISDAVTRPVGVL